MTATPAAPARMHSAAFVASMPPIATTGSETPRQISASPSNPIGGSASAFDGVVQTGPAPMYAARSCSQACASSTDEAERPSSSPSATARSAPSSSRPR